MTLFAILLLFAIVFFVLASLRITAPVDFFPLGWAFITTAVAFART